MFAGRKGLSHSLLILKMVQKKTVASPENISTSAGFLSKRSLSTDTLDYENAVQKLNSLQSNAAAIIQSQKQGPVSHVQQTSKIELTTKYLSRIGVSPEQLDRLSVVHVAGTKGKGTTAALCESILRRHGYRTGFFSSPHLVHARERIRLDGVPLSPRKFADYLENVFSRLSQKKEDNADMPAYFKFLTVMAYHVFLNEQVDVAIIEVGIGGEYDCTNCIRKPAVVGITTLGLDHTNILGATLPDIAWQKAGVLKPGAQAFTVPQPSPAAMDVLRERAANRQCSLKIAPPLSAYTWDATSPLSFQHMVEDVYATNASLALQMADAWLQFQSPFRDVVDEVITADTENVPLASPLHVTRKMAEGLEGCAWPGRTQVLHRGLVTYFLDGAHTEESIAYCVRWFQAASSALQTDPESPRKVLVFNTTGPRATERFLSLLTRCEFDLAVFPAIVPFPNQTDSSDQFSKLSQDTPSGLNRLAALWQALDSTSNAQVFHTVSEAVDSISGNEPCHVLVTGSVHLVGAALCVLDPTLTEPVSRVPATLMPLQTIYTGVQAIL